MRSGCYAVSLVLVATLSLGCGSCGDTRPVAVPVQPDLVAPGYAVTAIVFNVSRILGPAVAGFVIAGFDVATAFDRSDALLH